MEKLQPKIFQNITKKIINVLSSNWQEFKFGLFKTLVIPLVWTSRPIMWVVRRD